MSGGFTVRELEAARRAEVERILAKSKDGKVLTAGERKVLDAEIEARREDRPELKLTAGIQFRKVEDAAKAYGYSVRQVKNWKRDGRKARDPVPLDHPGEMPAWFERVYNPRECPDRLRDAVAALLEGHGGEEPAAGAAVPVVPVEVDEREVGFEATLNRARRREALLAKKLEAAIASQAANANQLETQWANAAAALRQIEKEAPKILEAQGVYLRRVDVRAELERLGGVIPARLQGSLRKRRRELAEAETAEDFEEVLEEAVEEACRELCDSRFAEPLELELAG